MATNTERYLAAAGTRGTPESKQIDQTAERLFGKDGWQTKQADQKLTQEHQEQANGALLASAYDPMQDPAMGRDAANLSKMREALDNGAQVNAENAKGQTALHLTHSVGAAEMLLEAGADPFAKDRAGHLPHENKNTQVAEVIKGAALQREQEQSQEREQTLATPSATRDRAVNGHGTRDRAGSFDDPFAGLPSKEVEQQAAEQSKPALDREKLFNDFKAQITAPSTQPPEPALEAAQPARARTLGQAAVANRIPPMSDRESNAPAQPTHARIMDIPIPQRSQESERPNGDAFNLENSRRVGARLEPTLGERMNALRPKETPAPEVEQGDKGRGEGGKERPTEPSFYTSMSVGGIAIPERDTKGAEIAAARRSVDRDRGRGGMGR